MKVDSSPNLMMVGHMKQVLDGHGIVCAIHREFEGAAIGETPPIETWPELWVADDSQAERAMAIIHDAGEPREGDVAPWTCSNCGEGLEGELSVCWKCGTERADDEDI